MKTKFFLAALTALLLSTQLTLTAQNHPNHSRPAKHNYRAMQCNQIIQALMLDDATAAKFKPVYEQYMADMRATRGKSAAHKKEVKAPGEAAQPKAKPTPKPMPTDSEVEQAIKDRFAQSRKMLDVREKYYHEFRKILSPKQIMRIYQIEKKNVNHAKKELKKRHDRKRPANNKKENVSNKHHKG